MSGRRRSSTASLMTAFLLPFAAFAAPTPEPIPDSSQSMILSNQTQFNDQGPSWACAGSTGGGSGGATISDCNQALSSISGNPQMGQFHHEPPVDAFSLPKVMTHGTCNVTLDIVPGAADYSSWTDVNLRVSQLISGCSTGDNFLSGTTGGARTAGNSGRIKISVQKTSSSNSVTSVS